MTKPRILVLTMSYNYHRRMAMNAENIVTQLRDAGIRHRYLVGSCQDDALCEVKNPRVLKRTRRFPMPESRKVDKVWLYKRVSEAEKYDRYDVVWITDADILYPREFIDALTKMDAEDFKGKLVYTALDFMSEAKTEKILRRGDILPTYRVGKDTDPTMRRLGRVPWGYCMIFHRPDLQRVMARLQDTKKFVHADRRIQKKARALGIEFKLLPGLAMHLYHNGSGAHWYKPAEQRF